MATALRAVERIADEEVALRLLTDERMRGVWDEIHRFWTQQSRLGKVSEATIGRLNPSLQLKTWNRDYQTPLQWPEDEIAKIKAPRPSKEFPEATEFFEAAKQIDDDFKQRAKNRRGADLACAAFLAVFVLPRTPVKPWTKTEIKRLAKDFGTAARLCRLVIHSHMFPAEYAEAASVMEKCFCESSISLKRKGRVVDLGQNDSPWVLGRRTDEMRVPVRVIASETYPILG